MGGIDGREMVAGMSDLDPFLGMEEKLGSKGRKDMEEAVFKNIRPVFVLDDGWKKMARERVRSTIFFLHKLLHDMIDWDKPVEFLDTKLSVGHLGNRKKEIDFCVLVTLKDGIQAVVHIEFQAQYDVIMPERMLMYRMGVIQATNIRNIFQIVVFVGNVPRNADHTYRNNDVFNETCCTASTRVVQLKQMDWNAYRDVKDPVYLALVPMMHVPQEDRNDVLMWMKLFFFDMCIDPEKFGVSLTDAKFYYGLAQYVFQPTQEEETIVIEQILEKYPDIAWTVEDFFQPEFIKQAKIEGLQEGLHIGEKKGRQEGRQEQLANTVRILRSKGFTIEQIAELLHERISVVSLIIEQKR
jgi:hypothetical protein